MAVAIVSSLRTHQADPGVCETGAGALANLCSGTRGKELAGRVATVCKAGAVAVVIQAMDAHLKSEPVQEHCCRALGNLTFGGDSARSAASLGRTRAIEVARAEDARRDDVLQKGATRLLCAALKYHAKSGSVQAYGLFAMARLLSGREVSSGKSARKRAEQVDSSGATGLVLRAMHAYPKDSRVQ